MTIDEITELLREYEELKKTVHRTGLISDQDARMDARARLCTPGNIKTLLKALKASATPVFTRKDVARALEQADTCKIVDMYKHFGDNDWADNVPRYVFDAFHEDFFALKKALLLWHDSLPAEASEPPPPKFKIGDMVRVIGGSRRPFKVHEIRDYNDGLYVYAEQSGYGGLRQECLELVEVEPRFAPGDWVRHKKSRRLYRVAHSVPGYIDVDYPDGSRAGHQLLDTAYEEAGSVVVWADDFEAWWQPGTKEINFKLRGSEDEPVPVPIALVRGILGKVGSDA